MPSMQAFYQGVPLISCEYRRSEGLGAEYGTGVCRVEDLPGFDVNVRAINWPLKQDVVNSLLSIQAWWDKFSQATVTELAPPLGNLKAPKILEPFGDLALATYEGGKPFGPPQVYQNVLIASNGIRELPSGRGNAELHKSGLVQFEFTDIRSYYEAYGPCIARINVKLRSGRWDPLSVQKSGQPWPASMALRYLFSQLPGSPGLQFGTPVAGACPEIIMEGEPTGSVVEKLLRDLGLSPRLQLDGLNYLIGRKVLANPPRRALYSTATQAVEGPPDRFHDEMRTVSVNRRPAAVQVTGKRAIQRISLSCVPVAPDTDGRIYRLHDLMKMWDWSAAELNRQVYNGREKQYRNVPPDPVANTSKETATLHEHRVRILKEWAYKAYAPARLFTLQSAPLPKDGYPSISDSDFENVQWLPATDVPMYVSELENLGKELPEDSKKGDKEGFVLVPPIVRAQRIRESLFFGKNQIQKYISGIIRELPASHDAAYYKTQIENHRQRIQDLQSGLMNAMQEVLSTTAGMQLRASRQAAFDIVANSLRQTRSAGVDGGSGKAGEVLNVDQDEEMWRDGIGFVREIEHCQKEIENFKGILDQAKGEVEKLTADLEARIKVIGGDEYIQAWYNASHAIIPSGAYDFDEKTCIIKFRDPVCHMDKSLVFALEDSDVKVLADGCVTITFGYERKTGMPQDWTTLLFVGTEAEGAVSVALAGVCQSSPLKALALEAPAMRLFLSDLGYPFNLGACIEEAAGLAGEQLSQPQKVEGYHVIWSGLLQCALGAGVSGVQHELRDDGDAFTHVFWNSPDSLGPLGPSRLTEKGPGPWIVQARISASRSAAV